MFHKVSRKPSKDPLLRRTGNGQTGENRCDIRPPQLHPRGVRIVLRRPPPLPLGEARVALTAYRTQLAPRPIQKRAWRHANAPRGPEGRRQGSMVLVHTTTEHSGARGGEKRGQGERSGREREGERRRGEGNSHGLVGHDCVRLFLLSFSVYLLLLPPAFGSRGPTLVALPTASETCVLNISMPSLQPVACQGAPLRLSCGVFAL